MARDGLPAIVLAIAVRGLFTYFLPNGVYDLATDSIVIYERLRVTRRNGARACICARIYFLREVAT